MTCRYKKGHLAIHFPGYFKREINGFIHDILLSLPHGHPSAPVPTIHVFPAYQGNSDDNADVVTLDTEGYMSTMAPYLSSLKFKLVTKLDADNPGWPLPVPGLISNIRTAYAAQ